MVRVLYIEVSTIKLAQTLMFSVQQRVLFNKGILPISFKVYSQVNQSERGRESFCDLTTMGCQCGKSTTVEVGLKGLSRSKFKTDSACFAKVTEAAKTRRDLL